MTRLLVLLALIAVEPIRGNSQAPAEGRGSRLLIDAVAFDRNGTPVLDLRQEELEVWISGYRVPIETLTAVSASDERSGRSIVLLLDT